MPAATRPAIAWSWRNAGLGLAYAVPAVVVTAADPSAGLAWAVGVLPAAALGLPGPRRARVVVVVVGALAGVSMVLGSLVSGTPALAVATVLALAVVVALTTANPRRRLAPLSLALGLPLVGAGLSEDPASGVGAALLILAGSVYAWLVSLLWPGGAARAGRPAPCRRGRPCCATGCRSGSRVRAPRRSGSRPASTTPAGPAPRRSS
ncbi:hypothetical protein GCM10025864_10510 [Luteimicrobium album]|uniref:Integral membrane protein n=1 Tax=Luteimicrobium album TaxID=1054550 RepID=A0ABQ6HY07_9MICO|nr:hypothetical protein [Luteimicrobium album]GMA23292.1 hypothetical protein GCM10025864_10510 [Luteimicrobium album]